MFVQQTDIIIWLRSAMDGSWSQSEQSESLAAAAVSCCLHEAGHFSNIRDTRIFVTSHGINQGGRQQDEQSQCPHKESSA